MYLLLSKAMCGNFRVMPLFYNKLRQYLTDMGSKLNPYDLCVAKKSVRGSLCMVC